MPLIADQLAVDEKMNQAKQILLERVEHYRSQITSICPPKKELEQSYHEGVEQLGSYRGQKTFFPYIGSGMGNGALVELADGSVKYDLISGVGVHFGRLHPRLVEASLESAMQDLVMQGHLIQNRDSYELMELLCKTSGFDHCFLSTSGAMANENALKIAFQKHPGRARLLAFENCFSGRTLVLNQLSDKPANRVDLPQNILVDYIPFFDHMQPEKSTETALKVLRQYLARYPNCYAAFCMELIQGEGGCYPGERDFFLALIKELKKHDILVWVDEVQTFGRTDHLFAFAHYNLQEHIDLVTIGKLAQLCATLYPKRHAPKPGLLAQTFTASTAQIRCCSAIVQTLLEDGYLGEKGKIMEIHRRFVGHFEQIARRHKEHFEGPYGKGLMLAFTPFKGEKQKVLDYLHALYRAGVIAFLAGGSPLRIRFLPPAGGITLDQVDHIATIIEDELVKLK